MTLLFTIEILTFKWKKTTKDYAHRSKLHKDSRTQILHYCDVDRFGNTYYLYWVIAKDNCI